MNVMLMSIYSKHHLMPYAIHEMRRHPRNVRFCFQRKKIKSEKKRKKKKKIEMTTKAATVIAQQSND